MKPSVVLCGRPFPTTVHNVRRSRPVRTSYGLSIFVIRAFVQMREALATHRELARRLDDLERKVGTHDRAIGQILEAIRQLTAPPEARRGRRIGFV